MPVTLLPLLVLLVLAVPVQAQRADSASKPAVAASEPPAINVGDPRIDGRRIQAGTITRKMVLTGMGPTPRDAGTLTQVLKPVEINGRAMMLSVQTFAAGAIDSALFDPRTLRPIRQRSRNPGRFMALDFDSAGARVTGQFDPPDKPAVSIDHALAQGAFDSNIADVVIAALPLAAGFTARIPVYAYESGLGWYRIRVTGSDVVPASDGAKTPVWAVLVVSGEKRLRYWIAKGSRKVLRSEYDLPRGMTLTIAP